MELTEWDIEFLERQINGDKKAGKIVKTKTGKIGRTYNSDGIINGKVPVYTSEGKFLCDPKTLKITGYVN